MAFVYPRFPATIHTTISSQSAAGLPCPASTPMPLEGRQLEIYDARHGSSDSWDPTEPYLPDANLFVGSNVTLRAAHCMHGFFVEPGVRSG